MKIKDYIIITLLALSTATSTVAICKYEFIQGPQGEQGIQGETGLTGATGAKGEKGDTGAAGVNGKDGLTPFIGYNGNWWLGDTDTGVVAGCITADKVSVDTAIASQLNKNVAIVCPDCSYDSTYQTLLNVQTQMNIKQCNSYYYFNYEAGTLHYDITLTFVCNGNLSDSVIQKISNNVNVVSRNYCGRYENNEDSNWNYVIKSLLAGTASYAVQETNDIIQLYTAYIKNVN